MLVVLPDLLTRVEDGREMPLLLWRFDPPRRAIASGPLGGGIGERSWALNATVPISYNRDDPDRHLTDLATGLRLRGAGLGFLTGVDVRQRVVQRDSGAVVVATVGIGQPEWAAAPARTEPPEPVGTINIFVYLPVALGDAALVNAVSTVAEAKVQAMIDLGYAASGTATDATCVICPAGEPVERYGGPRSTWGARLARAVHAAVLAGDRAKAGRPADRAGYMNP
jgi:adenosylcobinamide amidohydrolase